MRFFFTGGGNGPSGGGRVLNEVVQLVISKGYQAWLCLPGEDPRRATFVSNPAPVLSIQAVRKIISEEDVVIFGWHSSEEFELLQETAATKIFWQHGNLIPIGQNQVGAKMLDPKLIDQYWNVSKACGNFISQKYSTHEPHIVSPFFRSHESEASAPLPPALRDGILFQQRRGFDLYPGLKRIAEKHGERTTLLRWPFHNDQLLEELNRHKFFVSFDRGLRYNPTLGRRRANFLKTRSEGGTLKNALTLPAPWVRHKPKMLGFPISAAQAAVQGVIVIGFAMGGGLEWMSSKTAYLARDGSGQDLRQQLKKALSDSESAHETKRHAALEAMKKFDSERTWTQIRSALASKNS